MRKILLGLMAVVISSLVFINPAFAVAPNQALNNYQGKRLNFAGGAAANKRLPAFAAAPNQAPNNYQGKWWLNLEGGLAETGGTDDIGQGGTSFALGLGANYAVKTNQLLTMRSVYAGNIFGNNVIDIGVLYGVMRKRPMGYISASVGLAYVLAGKTKGLSNIGEEHSTVGVPIEVQAFLTPFKYFGVGLVGFADVNGQVPFGGGALAIQFGNLK